MKSSKKSNYDLVCYISKRYLNTNIASVVAVSWLHVLRDHPALMSSYSFLYKNIFTKIYSLFVTLFSVFGSLFLDLFYSLFYGRSLISQFHTKTNFSYIFVSHALSFNIYSSVKDFYFGSLPSELSSKHISVCTVYINHTKEPLFDIDFHSADSNHYKLLLPTTFDLYTELSFVVKLLINIPYFVIRFLHCPSFFSFWFSLRCIIESFSRSTRRSLRLNYLISFILSKDTKHVITTYEGHAWERLVYHAVHIKYPSIFCYGYLHALLFNKQFAATLKLKSPFNPDHIFTAGTQSYHHLSNLILPPTHNISTLGSPRSPDSLSIKAVFDSIDNINVLVLPEGLIDESLCLFDFSLRAAALFPRISFIWRVHPIIDLNSQIIPLLPSDLFPNIRISSVSLESDIAKSKYCLYRGSTAAVTAASFGCIPIFLDIDSNFNVDPLYEFSSRRPSVSSASLFREILIHSSWTLADSNYCKSIYTAFDPNHFFAITGAFL